MTSTRRLLVSILGAVLSTASLTRAQDAKATERTAALKPAPVIQDLALQPQRFASLLAPTGPVSMPSIKVWDLSRYRGFQFGMSLLTVAKRAEMNSSEAKLIQEHPAAIQELEWRPLNFLGASGQEDPVQEVVFSFYNGDLFRMLVRYDNYRTEGLTNQDMIEAISAKYGTATRPEAKIILFSSPEVYNDTESVVARWEDSQYSFNLFRSSYQPTFGMLVFSKRLDAMAQTAIAEAIRLDEQGAPQREIERQKKQDAADRAEQDKARIVNKTAFRP